MKHLKKFESFTINESIPKEPRGRIFGSFDGENWIDELDRKSTIDEIGYDYDEEVFYDYDSYINSNISKQTTYWFGSKRMFDLYQSESGNKPFIVRIRK